MGPVQEPVWTLHSGQKYNPNMDLELEQDPEFIPKNWSQFGTPIVIITLDASIFKNVN